jgi:hypothetical protein
MVTLRISPIILALLPLLPGFARALQTPCGGWKEQQDFSEVGAGNPPG